MKKCRLFKAFSVVIMLTTNVSGCNTRGFNPNGSEGDVLIHGGQIAKDHEFKSSVAIITKTTKDGMDSYRRACSGTKIGENFILTAAHCVLDYNKKTLGFIARPAYVQGQTIFISNKSAVVKDGALLPGSQEVTVDELLTLPSTREKFEKCEKDCWETVLSQTSTIETSPDIAVIKLKTQISEDLIPNAKITGAPAKVGDQIYIAGYGVHDYMSGASVLLGKQDRETNKRFYLSFSTSREELLGRYRGRLNEAAKSEVENIHPLNIPRILLSIPVERNGVRTYTQGGDSGSGVFSDSGDTSLCANET